MKDELDILDKIILTDSVVSDWFNLVRREAKDLIQRGIICNTDLSNIEDERAHLNPDGTVTIFVWIKTISRKIEYVVPKSQWKYIQ